MIRIKTTDVGATQVATVLFHDEPITHFRTHTRHDGRSIEIASEVIKKALAKIIERAAVEEGCTPCESPEAVWEAMGDQYWD